MMLKPLNHTVFPSVQRRTLPSHSLSLKRRMFSCEEFCKSSMNGASGASDAETRAVEARAWINAWRMRSKGAAAAPAKPIAAAAASLAPEPAPKAGELAQNMSFGDILFKYTHLFVSLASLFVMDKFLKDAFVQAAIKFPSPLVGMFIVIGVLLIIGEKAAANVMSFYGPALDWVAKWLPLFYVASLVTLPLAVKGIASTELLKILAILSFGMAGTLLFTAQITVFIRELVKTPNKEVSKAKPSSPFVLSHFLAWGLIAAVSLGFCYYDPAKYGAVTSTYFNLAITIGGYLVGNLVPKSLHGVLHPVVITALFANLGAAFHASLRGLSYDMSQKIYLTKDSLNMGAGDLLMSLLGLVIISFGFRVYSQRETMKRHAPEILGATLLSSLFSLFSSAFAAKAMMLPSDLARAMIPRSVTVALALPIGTQLDAPLAIVAAGVLLQGLLGANFGPGLMSAFGIKDTIARGLAAAGTAGGLGTASLTSKEPEALPFCALSYALVGILSTLLVTCPPVRSALIAIVG